MRSILFTSIFLLTSPSLFAQSVSITPQKATIANDHLAIEFNLTDGTYSGIDKSDNTHVFKDAWYRIGEGGWKEPKYQYKAERLGKVEDKLGTGEKLRVWYLPQKSYDPSRFLDITVYQSNPFFVIGWGVKNNKEYTIRLRTAEVLLNGILFKKQKCGEPRVLRGGAGAEPNFVEATWEINAHNSAMLTYNDLLAENKRRTIVAGGLDYAEFMRTVEFHKKAKGRRIIWQETQPVLSPAYMTLSIHDQQGKRVKPGEVWTSKDSFFVDITTADPFRSLERFGKSLAAANNANPNAYDFPTLCGWMAAQKGYGDGTPTNTSAALVEQMKIAKAAGITNYTPVAVRLEPDYYCYINDGDTQQGWWDDAHWSKYGSLTKPYETFSKFTTEVEKMRGKVFTYFQGSMPSNDFALAHPDWMLNDDISLLYEDHRHARPYVRFDYTNPDFQKYTLNMWKRLSKDGVRGIKFDYPETGWNRDGGFDDKSYTTVSAYRKIFELCREGMGKDAYIHERIMGFELHGVPRTDCNAGVVDLQRVWPDASHFEPEMSSRIGLRWYKQGTVFRYYPDGKSFHQKGVELDRTHRRSFLTLIGLLSGRIELGTSFGKLTKDMIYDLTRLYPTLPNGKSFRPVDFLLNKQHPEVYVYDVNSDWKQVILVNNDMKKPQRISAPISGDQASLGSLGFDPTGKYLIYDFWNENPIGIVSGNGSISQKVDQGEALVYSVKKLKAQPQIIGTNRHVMCGMFEIKNEQWDKANSSLKFNADLVAGETMKIVIHLPEDQPMTIQDLSAKNAESSSTTKGHYLTLSLSSKNKNMNTEVTVKFRH